VGGWLGAWRKNKRVAPTTGWSDWGPRCACALQCPIIERLSNSLMRKGRNNGKKLMANRITKHTLEIIHLLTDQNPIQVRAVVPCVAIEPYRSEGKV
jgi:hypothetical protein